MREEFVVAELAGTHSGPCTSARRPRGSGDPVSSGGTTLHSPSVTKLSGNDDATSFAPPVALPACRFFVVARACLDPAFAGGCVLFLPEWRACLQIVHDELARGERVAAMRAGDDHQHDLIGRLQLADAVDDRRVVDAPTR